MPTFVKKMETMEGSMQLKFEGQTHSIDANTLVSVLVHYQTIANVANQIYGAGARDIRINVNAIEQGSFIIDLAVAQNIVERLFSKDAVEYVAGLTAIIRGVYGLYEMFCGKPVKTDEERERAANITVNGDVTVNVYNQPVVREAISKSIEKADEDASVDGFSVTDKKTATHFPRARFKEYIYDDFDNEEGIPDENVVEEDAVLTIIGLKFERGSRWTFMYNGFKIPITVKDDALMRRIDNGERFGKGDAVRVKLKIVQRYNRDYRAFENKSYKITEFYEHIIAPNTPDMFAENAQ